jgi:hypothetical protein
MANVEGPDGRIYKISFHRNIEIEHILEECTKHKAEVFEGQFPWIRKRFMGGYYIHLAEGWRVYSAALRADFYIGHVAYLHQALSVEEKLAIAFHELVHIIFQHPEGHDLGIEKATTAKAIEFVEKSKSQLVFRKINVDKIIITLKERLQIYERLKL